MWENVLLYSRMRYINTQNMRDALDVKEADSMKHVHDYEIRYEALSTEEFSLLWESVK